MGGKTTRGAGMVIRHNREWLVHRYAYYLVTGVDLKRTPLTHTCGNLLCVNITHLKPKTIKQKMTETANERWTASHGKRAARCPLCKSFHILARKKNGSLWCRRCGHSWTPRSPKAQ